ncbi:MAG: serine/threonine-protein kinase [Nannocystaceae bacterium]
MTVRGPQRRREESWIGKTLDQRYKILEVFHETATHTVFVAQHLRLRKQVAIKIIQPEYASDGEIAARFAREATAGAQFDHPNVVGIIDCGRLGDGRTYLVTELVRGPSLREFLATHGRLHWSLACDIGAQLSEALIAAHAVGIVHRDVNPDHLLVEVRDDGSYWIKLTSFGISRMTGNALVDPAHELGSTLTRQGHVLGTAGYMSPEQSIGEEAEEAADAYALGVILWEAISGERLWAAATIEDALARQLHEESPPLAPFDDGPVPEVLQTVIRQLLARHPGERPRLLDPVSTTLRKLAHGSDFEESLVTQSPEQSSPLPLQNRYGGLPFEPERGGTVVVDNFSFPMPVAAQPGSSSLGAILKQLVDVLKAVWRSATVGTRVVLVLISAAPLILILLLLVLRGGDGPSEPSEAVAKSEATQPTAEPEKPPEAPPEPPPDPSAPKPEYPDELKSAVGLLLGGTSSDKEREAGAAKINGYTPAENVPAYIRAGAQMVTDGECSAKQEALKALRSLDDTRVLPLLQALDKSGRQGCTVKKKKVDCLGCLREDLARTVGRFEAMVELKK